MIFTAQAGFGGRNSVRLSIHLSVRLSHSSFVSKPNNTLRIFWHHTKGQPLLFFGWWAAPPCVWNLCSNWPTPSKNADFHRRLNRKRWRKSSIMKTRKSITSFPTSYGWSAYVTHKSQTLPKGGSKSDFFVSKMKFNFSRINSATKFLCVKTSTRTVIV